MKSKPISHRERVRLALEHKEADRIPIAFVCSGINEPVQTAVAKLLQTTRGMSLDEYFEPILDIKTVEPRYIGPSLKSGEDYWGVVRKAISYGSAAYDEINYYPLGAARSIDDLARHRWPSTDWFDYSVIADQVRQINAGGEYCLMGFNCNPFESTWYMRGFEQSFMDMVLAPEMVEFIMTKVTDFYVDHASKVLQAGGGKVDLMFTADDVGGQSGLLMSLDMWRRFLMPCHVRINSAIHNCGAKAIYHSDGSVVDAMPGLIEMGIDVLQALQFDAAGMDPRLLKDKYGDRLCFQGGVSVQKTLPFGTVEDVRREVRERIAVLGKDGGYILGPAHFIQAGTPPQNVLALFDTAMGA